MILPAGLLEWPRSMAAAPPAPEREQGRSHNFPKTDPQKVPPVIQAISYWSHRPVLSMVRGDDTGCEFQEEGIISRQPGDQWA